MIETLLKTKMDFLNKLELKYFKKKRKMKDY